MEPMLNPAIEKQAIGRVHRLGQKRNVHITRFIMQNSVEERILKVLKKKYGGSEAAAEAGKGESGELTDNEYRKPTPPAAAASSSAVTSIQVGSLSKDKNQLATEEFDILYGLSTEADDVKMEAADDHNYEDEDGDFMDEDDDEFALL